MKNDRTPDLTVTPRGRALIKPRVRRDSAPSVDPQRRGFVDTGVGGANAALEGGV